MLDTRTQHNVKLFLARLITNRPKVRERCSHVCSVCMQIWNAPWDCTYVWCCLQIFQPYAKFWLPCLMELILNSRHSGEGMHYFVVDVVVTMLSWASTAIPDVRHSHSYQSLVLTSCWSTYLVVADRAWLSLCTCIQDSHLASRLLEYLMQNCHHDNRGVFRNNLEIVKTLIELWRDRLQAPTK